MARTANIIHFNIYREEGGRSIEPQTVRPWNSQLSERIIFSLAIRVYGFDNERDCVLLGFPLSSKVL